MADAARRVALGDAGVNSRPVVVNFCPLVFTAHRDVAVRARAAEAPNPSRRFFRKVSVDECESVEFSESCALINETYKKLLFALFKLLLSLASHLFFRREGPQRQPEPRA